MRSLLLTAITPAIAGCAHAQTSITLPTVADPDWYILLPVDELPKKHLADLSKPKVDGISTRIRWSTLNPSKGKYNFALLDRVAAEAKKAGKPWTFRMMGGDAPSHVPQKGGYPIPGDPRVLTEFDATIKAVANRYANDPLLEMVHLPGPGNSAEMHVPSGVVWATNTMVTHWCHVIDTVSAAFPGQRICLNHSPEKFSPAVVQWMVSRPNLGKGRACFQMNALKADTNTSWAGYTVLKSLNQSGWPIGFQHACPSANRERFGGTFAQSIQLGKAAGASHYEIYQGDVKLIP